MVKIGSHLSSMRSTFGPAPPRRTDTVTVTRGWPQSSPFPPALGARPALYRHPIHTAENPSCVGVRSSPAPIISPRSGGFRLVPSGPLLRPHDTPRCARCRGCLQRHFSTYLGSPPHLDYVANAPADIGSVACGYWFRCSVSPVAAGTMTRLSTRSSMGSNSAEAQAIGTATSTGLSVLRRNRRPQCRGSTNTTPQCCNDVALVTAPTHEAEYIVSGAAGSERHRSDSGRRSRVSLRLRIDEARGLDSASQPASAPLVFQAGSTVGRTASDISSARVPSTNEDSCNTE